MFAQHTSYAPVLIECPDRRDSDRIEHRCPVQIDGRYARARDISRKGLSVVITRTVTVEDVVRVTLPAAYAAGQEVTLAARVARIEPQASQCVVGLEFLR